MWFLVNQFFWKVLEFWRTSSSTTILLWNVELVKEKDLVPQIFCSNSILIEKYIRFLSSILASTSTTLSWESWENILDVDDDVHEATHDEAPIGIAQPPKNLSQPIHRFSSLDGYTFFDFYRCFVRFLGVFYFWKPWIIIPSTHFSLSECKRGGTKWNWHLQKNMWAILAAKMYHNIRQQQVFRLVWDWTNTRLLLSLWVAWVHCDQNLEKSTNLFSMFIL